MARFNSTNGMLSLLAICSVLAGCAPWSSTEKKENHYEFRNQSEKVIWVDRVTGFQAGLGCGTLVPNARARMTLRAEEVPETFFIRWWEGNRQDRHSETRQTPVERSQIEGSENRQMLVFEFDDDETWRVYWE